MFDFPPVFDPAYYRNAYPEMTNLPDDILEMHYKEREEIEGRSACIYDRSEQLKVFLQQAVADNHLSVLEIGPFDAPFLIGATVKYFDVLDADGLKERAARIGRNGTVPECIDYVSPVGDLSIVNESFDMVFSSHLIEHQPNLLKHLQLVSKILNKGGMYVLCIPDKRYCFDHFNAESTVSEVLQAYVEDRKVHPFKSVIEHYCLTVHNNSYDHWNGKHGEDSLSCERLSETINAYLQADGGYIDVHSWHFTPNSFEKIINDLYSLGMINLSVHRLCHTVWGRLEFVAVLKKEESGLNGKSIEALEKVKECYRDRGGRQMGLENFYEKLKEIVS